MTQVFINTLGYPSSEQRKHNKESRVRRVLVFFPDLEELQTIAICIGQVLEPLAIALGDQHQEGELRKPLSFLIDCRRNLAFTLTKQHVLSFLRSHIHPPCALFAATRRGVTRRREISAVDCHFYSRDKVLDSISPGSACVELVDTPKFITVFRGVRVKR
jgi:hypothetical protein